MLKKRMPIHIEPVHERALVTEFISVILALLAAFIVAGLLIDLAGANPLQALYLLAQGGFGGKRQLLETLLRSAPLLLTGLATVIAFRGQIWSIGQEGQLFAGAMASYWAYTLMGESIPRLPTLIIIIFAGFTGGALLSLIAGLMKAYFNVDVIISTVLLNYIVNNIVLMLLYSHKYWMDPIQFYPRTPTIPDHASFPILFEGYRIHLGVVIALVSAIAIYLILEHTPLGYDIRAIGSNPVAARFQGLNINRILIITMVISGGLSGLAGSGEVFGVHHKLQMEISPGYGYTGIIVGMLAELNPLVTILTAFFFGGLINGSLKMVTSIGVPTALIYAIQAIILIFILAARVFTKFKISFRKNYHVP